MGILPGLFMVPCFDGQARAEHAHTINTSITVIPVLHPRRGLFLLLCGIALQLSSPELSASTCGTTPFQEAYKKAEFVFEGVVVARKKVPQKDAEVHSFAGEFCGNKLVKLSVKQVWKGNLQGPTTIFSEDSCWGLSGHFEVGDHKIVFAMKSSNDRSELVESEICGAVRQYTYRKAKILDSIRKGDRIPSDRSRIVDATIISSKMSESTSQSSPFPCGYQQELRINETFRGEAQSPVIIGSRESLTPGNRYLLHLTNDVGHSYAEAPNGTSLEDQRRLYECVQTLPELRTGWPEPMRIYELEEVLIDVESFYELPQSSMPDFVVTVSPGGVAAKTRDWEALSEDAKCQILDNACHSRGLVRWDEFRAWIKAVIGDQTSESVD